MKALSHVSSSVLRFALAAILTLGALIGFFVATASVASPGRTGQALALRATLHPTITQAALKALMPERNKYGRYLLDRHSLYGAKPLAGGNGAQSVLINEQVQTFDIFAPQPTFAPADGALTPTNLHPVWSADGTYIVFSSNRSADGHFHLYSISAAGDGSGSVSLAQITSGPGNEFYPALSGSNNTLAFSSDAAGRVDPQSKRIHDLYTLPFQVGQAATDVSTLTPITSQDPNTGFDDVQRPTWNGNEIAFSARTTTDNTPANIGHYHIYFLFTSSGGFTTSSNVPGKLTDGTADDTDPAWSPDGQVIAFASTASGYASTGNGVSPNPGTPAQETTPSASTGVSAGGMRTLYALNGNNTSGIGTLVPNASGAAGQITSAGKDDSAPAWRVGQPNLLAFSRGLSATNSQIAYFTAYNVSGNPSSPTLTGTDTGTSATTLNTSDPNNAFVSTYPTWAPAIPSSKLNSIAYQSGALNADGTVAGGRSITYNDPNNNTPSETPISIPTGSNGVGATYIGIFQSLTDDTDAPTLLPYNGGEVVHVSDVAGLTGPPRRNGDITAGKTVYFTVRLSDREAGVDPNNVYIQIKDPDSKYQDSKGLEHKVFVTDVRPRDNTGQSRFDPSLPYNTSGTPLDSGSAENTLYNAGIGGFVHRNPHADTGQYGDGKTFPNEKDLTFDSQFTDSKTKAITRVGDFAQWGMVGGTIGDPGPTQLPSTGPQYITVGRVKTAGSGTSNPIQVPDPRSTATPPPMVNIPGPDPKYFYVSPGQEYECQWVNAQYAQSGNTDTNQGGQNDYGIPYYLAGVDDQQPHFGGVLAPRPEWLHLTRAATQDNNGGVLFTATWTTPTSTSDYYLDVIAYDLAQTPPSATPPTTTAGTPTGQANFRIYDNVWGFSTQPFSATHDILVVNDNGLGQKFAATSFGGGGLSDILPMFYGTESYMTDVDTSLLPTALMRYVLPVKTKSQYTGNQPFGVYLPSQGAYLDSDGMTNHGGEVPVPIIDGLFASYFVMNTLGVNSYGLPVFTGPGPSYFETIVNKETVSVAGQNIPRSQAYDIWRLLARGPVSSDALKQYAPSFVKQPAVKDPVTGFTSPAADPNDKKTPQVPDAHKCVIWFSPFTGQLPLNQVGSVADSNTQALLRAFVKGGTYGTTSFDGGGRLFMTGQNIASSITINGTQGNAKGGFVSDILNAQYKSAGVGSQLLNATGGAPGSRITYDSLINVRPTNIAESPQQNVVNSLFAFITEGYAMYVPPSQEAGVGGKGTPAGTLILGNNYPLFLDNTGMAPEGQFFRTEASLDQVGPVETQLFDFSGNVRTRLRGQIDTITAANGAHTDIAFGLGPNKGDAALVYNEDPATGARTVFSSFGMEGMGLEYYEEPVTTPIDQQLIHLIPKWNVWNVRANIVHNIVSYLRTGTFTGRVLTSGSAGTPITGATVYLIPNRTSDAPSTVVLPTSRQTFSALTDNQGRYTISGVEPGAYSIVAYKAGYTRSIVGVESGADVAASDIQNNFTVEGDTTAGTDLNLTQQPFASISGKVQDNKGNPLAGAALTFSSQDAGVTVTGVSQADGTYSIKNVTPGNYVGTATLANYQQTSPNPTPTVVSGTDSPNNNFTLTPVPGTLGGLVTDSYTHQPIGGVTVTVTDHTTKKVVTTFITNGTATTSPSGGQTGDGGQVNYSGTLVAGTYDVTITPPANFSNPQTSTTMPITISANTFQRVDFTLDSTLGQIGGLVTDAAGNPLAGATVTLTGNGGTFTTTAADPNTPAAPVGDGQPANFFSSQVPAGTYTVTVMAPNRFTQTLPNPVTVTSHVFTRVGPVSGIALVSTLGTLGGLVTDASTGQALSGATVAITDSNNNPVTGSPFTTGTPTATPNDNGVTGDGQTANFYTGPNLPQGTYNITVSDQGTSSTSTPTTPDFVTQTVQVVVKAGQFTRKNIALVTSFGTVGGLISDSFTHQAIGGATITITGPTGSTVATITSRGTTTSPGAPTGDNNPQNYSARLYGGAGTTYTLTIAATNHTTQGPISVTVSGGAFKRQDVALVSTQGILGGLVQDSFSNQPVVGALVTVTDTKGKVVTTFTTTSVTTSAAPPNGDNNPVNYSGPLTAGVPYNVTVSRQGYGATSSLAVTLQPNTFTRVDFTGSNALPPTHIFPAGGNGKFLFFSVPYDYASIGVGFDQLFGPLNLGTFNPRNLNPGNANRSHVYVWNPTALQYTVEPAPPADGLHLGQGYWVFILNSTAVTVAGTAPTGTVSVNLQRGWNMIGVPSTTPISVSNLTFNNSATGSNVSFAAASSTYRLISPTLYTYNGTGYDTVTAASSMQPWQAYWIYAFTGTTVQIPTK